jgi:ParB-like chromosome segregation protein Spo0J
MVEGIQSTNGETPMGSKKQGEMPKVSLLNITLIKPYWRNPRDNNEEAVSAVAQSIADFGFNSPIVLDKNNEIINGHTRFKAAMELGLEEVPCVVLSDLSPDKVREYRIADNKTSELSKWNQDNLLPELRELIDVSSMQIYFGNVDLASILLDPEKMEIAKGNTQESIEKTKKELESKFDTPEQGGDDFIAATCPHCFESFNLDREYVLSTLNISE